MELQTDAIGWIAAASMLATFACQTLIGIRLFGIGANLAFIAYGWQAQLMPALFLHLLVLPLNVYHALRVIRDNASRAASPTDGWQTAGSERTR